MLLTNPLGTLLMRVPAMAGIWLQTRLASTLAGRIFHRRNPEPEPVAENPAPDQQRRDQPEAARKPDPQSKPAPARGKRQAGTDADPDQPVSEHRDQHRHSGVVEPAQHPGGNHLRSVENLE